MSQSSEDDLKEQETKVLEDRSFLHDLASPLFVLGHVLRKFSAGAENKKISSPEEMEKLLDKGLRALRQIEELHAKHREVIHARQSQIEKKKAA